MKKRLVLAAWTALLAAPLAVWAQESTPDPREILSKAMGQVAAMPALALEGALGVSVEMQGRKDEVSFDVRIELGPENAVYYFMKSPSDSAEIFSDGKKEVTHLVTQKKYTEEKAPKSRTKILGEMPGPPLNMATKFLGDFLHNDPALFEGIKDLKYAGKETLNDVPCEKLESTVDGGAITVWIQSEGDPWLQQVALDLSEGAEGGTFKVNLALTSWNKEIQFAENRFAFTPPEGVELALTQRQQMAKEPPHPLVGKPAPALKLPMLDGTAFDLAAFKEKNIVILDFWATWCGPCRIGLPIMTQIAKDYEAKGVKFFGVNVGQEDIPTINAFLKQSGLSFPVVHDENGDARSTYQAEGIPQTVVLDKSGTVRVVHQGISPWFEEELREQLDGLIAGSGTAK
ncbi:MAG: redoxin family protein [Candidatus Hydrogenedentes bacterium]|nr:redoxin family protein [Candidatus Hydrogenedentota bacterium]